MSDKITDKCIELPSIGKVYPNDNVIVAFNDVDKYYIRKGKYRSTSNELRDGWYLEPYDTDFMKKAYEKLGKHSLIGNKTLYERDIDKIKQVIFTEDKVRWNLN